MSGRDTPAEEASVSMDALDIDPGAVLRVGDREQLVEVTYKALADGRSLIELHDEDGELVASVSLRPEFMVRREAASREAAA